MAINIKFNELGIFGIVIGVAGTIYGVIQANKTDKVARKLDKSIDDLDRRTVVNVQKDIIEKATMNAVERQVSGAVKKAIDEVSEQIRSDCDSMIRKDVDRVYSDLKDSVQERVSEEIATIDYDEMRNDIRRKAEHKVFEEIGDVMSAWKLLGNTANGKGLDFEGLAKLADKLPVYEREGFLSSVVRAMR